MRRRCQHVREGCCGVEGRRTLLRVNAVEHGRVLEHVGQNHEAHVAAAQVAATKRHKHQEDNTQSEKAGRGAAAHTCSKLATLPSFPVSTMPLSWQLMLSSASTSRPRYISPLRSSTAHKVVGARVKNIKTMATCAAARAQPAILNQSLMYHLRLREVEVHAPSLLQSK